MELTALLYLEIADPRRLAHCTSGAGVPGKTSIFKQTRPKEQTRGPSVLGYQVTEA